MEVFLRLRIELNYTFSGKSEAEASDLVITSTILICDHMAYILFDPRSTYSYVSVKFALGLNLIGDTLDNPMFTPRLGSL